MTIFAIPLIDAAPLVKAAGLLEQSLFKSAGLLLVTPLMAIRQLAVPTLIAPPDTPIVDGAVSTTDAAQPAPVTDDVAPVVNRKPAGSVSMNAIPD
ncbi:MAG: hypothetical protein IPP88_23845 [Betaproteobacteria bacterium]|nr:hypothetical protein [Betaproteobacteria bacterium]